MIYIIAELGINHNGSLDLALDLMREAKRCGADAVKFQVRTIETVFTAEELAKPRPMMLSRKDGGPWSGQTNGDWKRRLELSGADYDAIHAEAFRLNLDWSASCWDVESVNGIARQYDPKWLKIPSALITDLSLLRAHRATGIPCYVSTGMSTWEEIDAAVSVLGLNQIAALLHCHSSYPSPLDELNLACIRSFQERYSLPVGYSSHTVSPWPCLMAAVYGAEVIEAHLTLDRTMVGTDQAASLEPHGFAKMVNEIRTWERCKGDGIKRVWPSEEPIKAKLRRYG